MKRFFLISKLMLICFLIVAAYGIATAQKLPVIDGKETVAIVNDEPITLEEFNRVVASSHTAMSEKKKAGKISYSAIMRRLINIRLILLEAKNMGLDELPEIKNLVDSYSRDMLMKLLMTRYLKDLKADKEEVESLYKEAVREWKLKSVFFEKEDGAKKFEEKIKAGKDFDELMKKAVEEGIAKGSTEGDYLKKKDLKLPVHQIVSKMKVGSVSPVARVGKKGFIIFKLEGIRHPEDEDSKVREMAEREALKRERARAAKEYYSDLKQRYVKIDEKLLDSLDYESKEPGFENLLKDERIVAAITGEKPITVGKLTTAINKNFYHGIKGAIESKRVNTIKRQVLEELLQKRVLYKEAIAQGIDQTESYKNQVKEYKNSVTFDMFIKKVVAPEIKYNLKELKAYYNKNREKYTSPEMMRIKSLVFAKRGGAADALDKLMKGTDFDWLSSNADGQIDKTAEGLLKFEGRMLILNTMPEDVQKAVSNAKPGDFRLYESPEGQFYVLYVYHVVDPKLKPFDDVKAEIAKKVFQDKLEKTIEVWADKLREYYPVKIYRKDLRK
jgi:parvulin-like peptidyl-prolyl isomerase